MCITLTLTFEIGQGQMQIESQYMISHLMTIVIFFLSVTISKMFIVEMCMSLTLSFRIGRGKM